MAQIEVREQRLTDHLDGSVKKSVTEAVAELIVQLHGRMTHLRSSLQNQLKMFEKKWENKMFSWSRGQLRALLPQLSTGFG